MAIDLQPLVDRFYDYFLDLYHKQSDAEVSGAHADTAKAGEPFLAFGGIGAVITPDMFQLGDGSPSTALVTEQFSGLANLLPDLDGTSHHQSWPAQRGQCLRRAAGAGPGPYARGHAGARRHQGPGAARL